MSCTLYSRCGKIQSKIVQSDEMPSDGGGQKHKEEVFSHLSSKEDIRMKLHFYGADRCVTGSCHCLEINGKKILVDCGLQQGRDELDNRYLAFAPGNIDILLVTHAHIDHTGRIPLLVKNGFHGRILTTRLTADLDRKSVV